MQEVDAPEAFTSCFFFGGGGEAGKTGYKIGVKIIENMYTNIKFQVFCTFL